MTNEKLKAVASWSGGKESVFACYNAISGGIEISHILNFISKEFKRVLISWYREYLNPETGCQYRNSSSPKGNDTRWL